jgi:glutamate synthase (NADPH/NADH) small chain
MGDPKGFLKIDRQPAEYRPVQERIHDYQEVIVLRTDERSQEQASRCMDCSTPFCHWGCPVGNRIPEWNDLVFKGNWERALALLQATNNFPEFTGRLCPALCEFSCVLGINDAPVTIRENELAIIEHAFSAGLIKPNPPLVRTGKKVAVVGSGPAGLACADQLNKAGHSVVVFERDPEVGGILRYGIPDFKLEKHIIDRRVNLMQAEGVEFRTGVNIGVDCEAAELKRDFEAVCLAGGSRQPRDLKIDGRYLRGIYFAMDFLTQANKRVQGETIPANELIDAGGKNVVVVGGGDTGADCIGVANRQGAARVIQIELLPQPPESRTEAMPWPKFPTILKTSSSHEEGGQREWSVLTKKLIGEDGWVKRFSCVRVEFPVHDERGFPVISSMTEIPGTEFEIEADMVILAVGFAHPEHHGLLQGLGVGLDARGNVKTDKSYMTSVEGVFSAGDMRRGQSLIVWAIAEGRSAARCIDQYLMGETCLPAV